MADAHNCGQCLETGQWSGTIRARAELGWTAQPEDAADHSGEHLIKYSVIDDLILFLEFGRYSVEFLLCLRQKLKDSRSLSISLVLDL